VQLSIPIYSGGAVDSRVRDSIAALYKARAELETARRQAGSTARQAFAGVANGISQIEALMSAVDSSISAVKANQVGYRLGTRINIDVLNAEQQLYTSKRDLIKARYETLLHGLKLKAAAGSLTDDDVVSLNGWFKGGKPAPSAQWDVLSGLQPGTPKR
jgi:outer membrane protein